MSRTHNGEDNLFTNGVGKVDVHMQKNDLDLYLIPHTKINSKLIKHLNVMPETLQLLE